MKMILSIALISGLGYNLYSQDFGEFNSSEEISLPVPEMEAEKSAGAGAGGAEKEWTIMVFMNAKNNLEKYGVQDMNEMERIGSTGNMNVVVEMGRMEGYDSSNGDWKGVKRFYVTNDILRDPLGRTINSRVVEDLGARNMGDYREVINFVKWAKGKYPAKKYMLVLWNHGGGWTKDNPVEDKGISYDEETGNNISTPQLGSIVSQVGKLDILASDACLMQMAEVAYEVKDGVDFMVGSEETEPGAGYSYYKILFPLSVSPSMSAETLSKIIVLAYWDSNIVGLGVATHSSLGMSQTGALAQKMNRFAEAAVASGEKEKIKEARAEAQSYAIDDNKDLKHFADLVKSKTGNAALRAAAGDLSAFLADRSKLVIDNKTSIIPSSNSNGIAVYVPGSFVDGDYAELKLAKDTQWDEFLKWLVKK